MHLTKSRFYDRTQCFRLTNWAPARCYGQPRTRETNGSEFVVVHSWANIPPNYTVLGQAIYGKAKGAPIK